MKQKVAILGIGYVGMVQGVCLARHGIEVVLFDNKVSKNGMLQKGEVTVVEPGVQELFDAHKKNIHITSSAKEAVVSSNIVYICVGTPPGDDGAVNLKWVYAVADEIANALKQIFDYRLIVLRSTVPPGTSRDLIARIEAQSGKKYGKDFGFSMHPEFLREGKAIEDFTQPPFTVFGVGNEKDAETLIALYRELQIKELIFSLSFEEAELFKYINNNFHALKVSFANEVAQVGKKFNVDAAKLMNIFVLDSRQNISPYYLMPGLPFGGSCLTKDNRALKRYLEQKSLVPKTMLSPLESNEDHFRFIFEEIEKFIQKHEEGAVKPRIGIVGMAFKKGVDDLRESPYVRIFQFLNSRGYDVSFYDPLLDEQVMMGQNLKFINSIFRNFFEYQELSAQKFIEKSKFMLIGCGNGLEDILRFKKEFSKRHILCLDPFLVKELKNNHIEFKSIF